MGQHVVVRYSVGGTDQGDVIDDRADVREQLRDLGPGLSIPLERVGTGHDRPWKSLPHHNLAESAEGLSVIFLENWFGIERVDVADSARHEQRDYGFGARLEMRLAGSGG